MEKSVEGITSPAKEFLPLLEQKLKKLIEQRDQVCLEIEETRKMIDEIKVKLSGGELPLPIGQSVARKAPGGSVNE
ncbi:MAG: hypothetical protein ABSE48_08175 [Verrucomicrobiota bacterium]|jgi:hypothetical protein